MRRLLLTTQRFLRTSDMNDEDGRAKATEGGSECPKTRAAAPSLRWKVRVELPPIRWTPTRSLHLQPSGKLHTLAARALELARSLALAALSWCLLACAS